MDSSVGALYSRFAFDPWYQRNNQELLDLASPIPAGNILDIGCGVGSGTELLAAHTSKSTRVYGVDSSPVMINYSSQNAMPAFKDRFSFRVGTAENFGAVVPEKVNSIFSFNAVHLFSDLPKFFGACAQKLEVGGHLAFNTGFSSDALDKENMRGWIAIMRALRKEWPKDKLNEARETPGGPRCKIPSGNDFIVMLSDAGFSAVRTSMRVAELSKEACLRFAEIPGLGHEMLPPGLTPRERSEMMGTAFDKANLTSLKRNWLLVVAVR